MRVHHLNCGGVRLDGRRSVNHCLLVEAPSGLVLVDSGFGLRDVFAPTTRLSRTYLSVFRPHLRSDTTAVRQVKRLGFDPSDVRHIILSHLDCDRAGGLDDFPAATVHVLRDEVEAASSQASALDRRRYRPEQWSSRLRWRTYGLGGESFWGFHGVQRLAGLPPEILLVPMPGHTAGHAGVAVRCERGWLLYAGDAFLCHGQLDGAHPSCPPSLRLYQWVMEKHRAVRVDTLHRLRVLAHRNPDVAIVAAHDPVALARLGAIDVNVPRPILDTGSDAFRVAA